MLRCQKWLSNGYFLAKQACSASATGVSSYFFNSI